MMCKSNYFSDGDGRREAVAINKRPLLAAFMIVASIAWAFSASPARSQDSFNGYQCTDDCSGHQAGYNWAEQNDVSDPDECGGNSQSFIEGCQSYTEQNDGADGDNDDQMNSDDNADGDADDSE
jgi:hypothetical protein